MVPEPPLGLLTYLEARGWSAVTDEQQNVCQLDTGLVSAALSTSLSWSNKRVVLAVDAVEPRGSASIGQTIEARVEDEASQSVS